MSNSPFCMFSKYFIPITALSEDLIVVLVPIHIHDPNEYSPGYVGTGVEVQALHRRVNFQASNVLEQ